jgi:spore maturation protein SpmA
MLNYIWLGLVLAAVLIGGFQGRMKEVADGAISGAETAAKLALGLIGIMALWLGIMRLAEKSGLIHLLAKGLAPILRRLFPDVPPDHPAMGSIVLNMAANMLGLVNAATPLGLRAMKDLQKLNPNPGVATNAMCTFLAINTSSIQLIPITAIGILAAAGSKNPSAIIGTALLATTCSTLAGVFSVKFLEKLPWFRIRPLAGSVPSATVVEEATVPQDERVVIAPLSGLGRVGMLSLLGCFGFFFYRMTFGVTSAESTGLRAVNSISLLAIPFLLSFIPAYAFCKKLKVYEEFVAGAKEGFDVAIRIIPFLVTMLAAAVMFRESNGIALITKAVQPLLDLIKYPPELLPITLMRPLSGSGSLALFSELVKQYGPDSLLVRMAGTLYGSTETTFYVIAVYFGSVAVHRTRHALLAGLIADGVGAVAAVYICRAVFAGG